MPNGNTGYPEGWDEPPEPHDDGQDYYADPYSNSPDSQAGIDAQPASDDDGQHGPPSWAPIDLARILDGSFQPPEPELLPRDDGICLLYRGLTHSFHGESESGKSLVAQVETVRLLNLGRRVLYIDYESDPASVVSRLITFGADPECIRSSLAYVQPESDPQRPTELRAWVELLGQSFDLVVIDGVTAALSLSGTESKDNDQVTRWMRRLPEALARRTGAAVVLIDHVVKDAQARGRFAIGGQAKMAALTGAAYTVEVDRPIGIGLEGVVVLRVSKDRPGYLRSRSGPYRPGDRTQEAARVVIDSRGGTPIVRILAPADRNDGPSTFRPTVLMEKVSRLLETATEPMSKTRIEEGVSGKTQHVRTALEVLIKDGYVTVTTGARAAQLHAIAKAYRERDDPGSAVYTPEPELPE